LEVEQQHMKIHRSSNPEDADRRRRKVWGQWMKAIQTFSKAICRFGIPQTVEARRFYRELIVTTAGLVARMSGAVLSDETLYSMSIQRYWRKRWANTI
jgi:hypothetical protein